MKHINLTILKSFKIPLPPLEVQEEIVKEIAKIEKKEEKAKEVIKGNEEEIKGMIGAGARVRLGDILSLEYGVSLPKGKIIKGQYPVCGSNGIDGFHNDFLLEASSIIVGRKGSAGKVNWIDKNCTTIGTTFYVKNNPNKIGLRYAFYTLKNVNLENLIDGIGTPGLNRDNAYDIKIPHLPLEEQKKIIAKIEPLEKEITEAKEFLSNAKNLKQNILDKYLK
mgnify:FL=1